jgi:gamma-glutamylcysteine synthetase
MPALLCDWQTGLETEEEENWNHILHIPSKLTAPTETLAATSDVTPAAWNTVDEK